MDRIRVLLADDHAIVRAGIRKMVEEIPGLEVVAEVGNGSQVFAALEQYSVECLLIDVVMPEFDPVPAIRQIRARYPDLKILVISAYNDDIYVQGLLNAGVDGYHLKDQPLNDLKLAIERILHGERWLSSPLINKLLDAPQRNVNLPPLSPRQRELLQLLYKGKDNQTIAQEMGVSIKTVENNLTRLYRHLNVHSRLEAVHYINRYPQILGLSGRELTITIGIPSKSPTSKGISMLVVDDNARYRSQLQRMIGRICPQAIIYEAWDIQSAVTLAKQISPHLVLVDVVLGDEDGIRCARQVKMVSPNSRMILISAYPDREFHRLGLQAGAVAFLDLSLIHI